MDVAPAAPAAFSDDQFLAVFNQVTDFFTGEKVINGRADRHLQVQVLGCLAVLGLDAAVFARLSLELAPVAEIHQGSEAVVGHEDNGPAPAAVTAGWSPVRHEFFMAEGHHAVPALSGLDFNFSLINKC